MLKDLDAILRETGDFGYVSVMRVREDTVVDEDGNHVTVLVRDDIGMGDRAAVTVGGWPGGGSDIPYVTLPFTLPFLKDIGPRKLAGMITPELSNQLKRAQPERVA